MKRIAGKLLVAAVLVAAVATAAEAGQASLANLQGAAQMADGVALARTQRPPAPEVWSFRVEYSERRGPQFQWGPWHVYTTITGEYNKAKKRANNVADFIEGRSKNVRARIIETRIS
jgi:hypothetical protein